MLNKEHAFPEDNDNPFLPLDPNLDETSNHVDPPGSGGDSHHQHHPTGPLLLENKNASEIDQGKGDAIEELGVNGDDRHDGGVDSVGVGKFGVKDGGSLGRGGEGEPVAPVGDGSVVVGTATTRPRHTLAGGLTKRQEQKKYREVLHLRLLELKDKNTEKLVSPPAALRYPLLPFDEDNNVPVASAAEDAIAACSSSSAIPEVSSAILEVPSDIKSNTQSVDGDTNPVTSSSSLAEPLSLPLTYEPEPRASPLPWRAQSLPALPFPPLTAMLQNEDFSTPSVTLPSQAHLARGYASVSSAEDRSTFSAHDVRDQQEHQGLDSVMAPWSPSTATSFPLFPGWADMPGTSLPNDNHQCHKVPTAAPYGLASVPLPPIPLPPVYTASTAGGTWPDYFSSTSLSSYPSAPVRIDPASLAEYARYPVIKSVSALHDALPPSTPSAGLLPYPIPGYFNGSGYRPTSYPSSTIEMHHTTRPGLSTYGSFSTSTHLGTGSSSRRISMPNMPYYDQMSSSLMVSGTDPMAPPPLATDNSCYNPSSMSGLISSLDMSGCPSTATYTESNSQGPYQRLLYRQQNRDNAAARISNVSAGVLSCSFSNNQELQGFDPDPKHCNNCKTTATPSWRRCPQGRNLLCNACGLYQKLHGRSRPFFKAKDGTIRMHRRIPEHDPCTICKATQSPVWKKDDSGAWICNGCYAIGRQSLVTHKTAVDVSSSGEASRPSSPSPSPVPRASPYIEYSSNIKTSSTSRCKKISGAKSAAESLDQSASSLPMSQGGTVHSANHLQPPPLEAEQPFKTRLRSSSRRGSYAQVKQPQQRSTSRGATAIRNQEEIAPRVTTKTKKRQAIKYASNDTDLVDAEAAVPSMIYMYEHNSSMSDQILNPRLAGGHSQGRVDVGADDYRAIERGGGELEYGMSEWRGQPYRQSSSPFNPVESEPFLPSPEGSHNSNGSGNGTGGSLDRHHHQRQSLNQLSSYRKRGRRSHVQQDHPYHGYYQNLTQQQQQQQRQNRHYAQQHQLQQPCSRQHDDRQHEFERYHPTPPSDLSYSPLENKGYQSETLLLPMSSSPGSNAPTVASTATATGSNAVPLRRANTQAQVGSSSSAIPDNGNSMDGPVLVTISEYVGGESSAPAVRIKHDRGDDDHRDEYLGVKTMKVEGPMVGKGKQASVTKTGRDLSSVGEYFLSE
ncbi:hypothetical protein BGZ95_006615 [Linnemannia exigua]|uniref:GATA-type domain-containing protein n=1 Tax=Linnemannia exigua TaxID=604196 RepID=A0AAD4DMS6_9FUNG|nr:hypothetical protein BGZ95_006615 [Linnemannia exigua]